LTNFKFITMKKYLLFTLYIFPFLVYSQTEIFNVAGGGALPDGWVESNNDTAQPIDKSSYYLLEPHTPSDMITTSSYDLSSYSQIILSVDIKSYSSGTYNSLLIEVSTDGGTTFNEAGTTNPVTSSYVNNTVSIQNFDSGTILRLSNSGTSGRGIRLQNIVLNAYTSDPSVIISKSSVGGLGYVDGNSSLVSGSFDVSGLNLTEDITISPDSDFEISLDDNTYNTGDVTLDASSGSVSATTVYVKLSSGKHINTYTGNLGITSSGESKVVALSGKVYADPFVQNLPKDLFISEYSEGTSSNKYLEIYNPTDQTVDLSAYAIASVSNGSTIIDLHEYFDTFSTGATIASGETYLWANSSSVQTILDAVANGGETGSANFNGDDGYALAKGTSESYVIIDIIGDFNVDPGSGWNVAGVANATKDKTLVRKSSVTQGNNNFTASAGTTAEDSEWIVYDKDTWTYIGAHTLSTFDFADQIIKVYPNPVNSSLNISGLNAPVQASVFDMLGKLHIQSEVTKTLDVSALKSGLYMIEIKNATNAKVFKMIKK
jgi:hypothetical protein